MFRSCSPSFPELRGYLDAVPVIETHEHFARHIDIGGDAIDFLFSSYYHSDFWSAGGEGRPADGASPKERFRQFRAYYIQSDKTAYARGMQEGLRQCWGAGVPDTYEEYQAFEEKLKTRNPSIYNQTMERLGIKAKIVDSFSFDDYLDGKTQPSEYARFAFPLPRFHNLHNTGDIPDVLRKCLNRTIVTLDDYTEAFNNYFQRCVDFGIVCIKDQSAYRRSLAYGNPCKADAESAFNDILYHPRDTFGDDHVRALDDWLFHHALRLAAKHKLPVQLHTGHMAGIRNEIAKTNAALLTPVLELHRDVTFGLFHGNWPFMDEYLFLGKNYPNVYLDLCWVQCIDPLYSVELMKRAVMTVPHSKIMAFGGDTGAVEWVAGYLALARDNVACALAELTDSGWLTLEEAKRIAADWFFNNPNAFFKLGFDAV